MATAYRYHSIEPEGLWTSEPFPAAERRHIVQGVIAGFLSGRPRWATTLDGTFVYGLDAKGKEMKAAPSASRNDKAPRHHATKKSAEQIQREIDEVLSKRTSTGPQLATWRSGSDIRAATKKGDRLDNFGQIWRVTRVSRNKITAARELADPRDPEKVVLVDQRDFHPRDIAHMRNVGGG